MKKKHSSKSRPVSPASAIADVPRRFPRRLIVIVGCVAIVLCAFIGVRIAQSRHVVASRAFHGQAGPWGHLDYVRIAIEPPAELIVVDDKPAESIRWFFKGCSAAQLADLFASADLTAPQRLALLDQTHWEITPAGIRVTPGDDVVLQMAPTGRQKIYLTLAHFPENVAQSEPFAFPADSLDERIEGSGLHQETIDLFKRLLYPGGSHLLFSDAQAVVAHLSDRQEKVRFLKMIFRRVTFLMKLKVMPDDNIDELTAYWGAGHRGKDVRPLLESLARIPGGCSIDITHLLTPMARRYIYTYPPPTGDGVLGPNCHWTSLNFFNDRPDDRFLDGQVVKQTLESDYERVISPRMGDVLCLVASDGTIIHSAVYLADDTVFTKNGASYSQPWIFMKLDMLLDYYSTFCRPGEPPQVEFYRHR